MNHFGCQAGRKTIGTNNSLMTIYKFLVMAHRNWGSGMRSIQIQILSTNMAPHQPLLLLQY